MPGKPPHVVFVSALSNAGLELKGIRGAGCEVGCIEDATRERKKKDRFFKQRCPKGAPLSSDSAGATVSGTSKTELDLIWESGCSSSVLVERFSFCMLSTPARAAAGKQALFKPEGGVRGDKDRKMRPRGGDSTVSSK